MNRFNIVNNMMQKNDDDDEEEVDKMGDDEPEQEETSEASSADYNAVTVEFDLPQEENLDKGSLDNQYWKVTGCEESLDDLLADFE